MPELKVFGRPLTDLEQFVVDTPGVVDQVAFGDRLALLLMTVEQNAFRNAYDQWRAEFYERCEKRRREREETRRAAFDELLPVGGTEDDSLIPASEVLAGLIPVADVLDGPSVSENVARLARSTSVQPERTPCSSCGRVEGHTPGCRIVPSLTPPPKSPKPEVRPRLEPTPNMDRKKTTTKPAKRRKKG